MHEAFVSKVGRELHTVQPTCLQVNLGKLCNQACLHCHVDAGPKRTEIMARPTIDAVIRAVEILKVPTVDLTGGAPEMNPHFRELVVACRQLGVTQIIDRCNLTILLEPGYEWLLAFLVEHKVEISASLPFYMEDNVDRQRGKGVFDKSIEALRRLNQAGYGQELPLNLVFNPQGAYLPPEQDALRTIYKGYLLEHFGIRFNDLYTITNMPINRFRNFLKRSGNYNRYMKKLESRYNPATLDGLMCRSLISVGWDGQLYDCDFNQMLEIPVHGDVHHIGDIESMVTEDRQILVDDHCYACTAGSGSSCGGALDSEAAAIQV